MVYRHLAFFNCESGDWIGEWAGHVPVPRLPPGVIGDARTLVLNAWIHEVQRLITPSGSPYELVAQEWDLAAWDECPRGGAVCLDVTHFSWPVSDQRWHRWVQADFALDWPDHRLFIKVERAALALDSNVASSRPVRSTPEQGVVDITGTRLEPFHGRIFGHLRRDDAGRIWLQPFDGAAMPEETRCALQSAPLDLDLVVAPVKEAVTV